MAQKTFLRPFSSKRLLRRRAGDKLSCEAVALELVRLLPTGRKNANHDGVTQQICDRLRDFETENQMLIQAVNGVHTARQKEDAAYRRFSGKDLTSSSRVTTRPFMQA